MVKTPQSNKGAHPGAPAMTNSVRIKAGISSTKRQHSQTKEEQIHELKALVAAANSPDDVAAASKEPLVG